MHNVVKWPNILKISCGMNTVRFLKYVWPFYNIMHERFKCIDFTVKFWVTLLDFSFWITLVISGFCFVFKFTTQKNESISFAPKISKRLHVLLLFQMIFRGDLHIITFSKSYCHKRAIANNNIFLFLQYSQCGLQFSSTLSKKV